MEDRRDRVSTHRYRTCYDDTDAGGVVYYANYLRYMERGRNQYLREMGRSVRDYQDEGILFVVVDVHLRYRSPAGLDEELVIETRIEEATGSSVTFRQGVRREGEDRLLVEGTVKVACLGHSGRVRRLPQELMLFVLKK